MELISRKKGQVGTLAPAIIALVFAAILLVFGLIISQSLRDTDSLKTEVTVSDNETTTAINATGFLLATEDGSKTDRFVLTAAWDSLSITIPLTNLSVADTGLITNVTIGGYTAINVTYTYYSGTEAWDSSNNTITGLGTFADFWEIIVLAIVVTVVIGLLLVVFGGRGTR